MQKVTFHDHKPATLNFYDAVINGLSLKRKSIPPKFFYDEWGSKLFERICEQPEYYPPTVERRMLIQLADEIASLTGGGVHQANVSSIENILTGPLSFHGVIKNSIMIGSFDYTAGIVSLQTPETPFCKIHLQVSALIHGLFYIFYQLLIGIPHQNTAESGCQWKNVVTAVPAENNIPFLRATLLRYILQGGLLCCACRQKVQQPLAVL